MKCLITGITGQDGSYLADLLLSQGHEVVGVVRRSSVGPLALINLAESIGNPNLVLTHGDLSDPTSIINAIATHRPEVIYHLADQDHVGFSRDTPAYSVDVTGGAVARLLEFVRVYDQTIKVMIACSATMFGRTEEICVEDSPLNPESPYACAKSLAFLLARHYRRQHGMHVSTAIMYNHDSPRRHGDYLLHSMIRSLVADEDFVIYNPLDRVSIGYAPEYVEAMTLMTQQDLGQDYVLSQDHAYSIEEMCQHVLKRLERDETTLDITNSVGGEMRGDSIRARTILGWRPRYNTLQVIDLLVEKYAREV